MFGLVGVVVGLVVFEFGGLVLRLFFGTMVGVGGCYFVCLCNCFIVGLLI